MRAALGKPIKIRTLKNDFGPYVEYRFSGGIRVTFQGKTNVTAVTTTGKSDLTTGAIGVGSTENQVQARSRASSARASARPAPATPASSRRARP